MITKSTASATGIWAYPNNAWQQAMFKWPVQLWRLGLGPVIGKVMMIITHTGRNSGLPRRTMVEHYWQNGRPYAVSGWGAQSQWVKNLLSDPRCTIQTAQGTESATAVRVNNDAELWNVYHLFMEKDPYLTKIFLAMVGIDEDPDDFVAHKNRVYLFRFDPSSAVTPPPLEVDLQWVLPLIIGALLSLWAMNKIKK